MRTMIVLLLVLASAAHADTKIDEPTYGKPEPFEPRVSPTTARWISIATTATGLGLSGYLWYHAGELPEDNGRSGMQLASFGTGLAAIGIGPASGLIVAGEYRRSVIGAVVRPAMIASGAVGAWAGRVIIDWGCYGTSHCTPAKIGGGLLIGAGALMAAGGLAWGVYDIWDTPSILRRRMPKQMTVTPLVGSDRVGIALTIVD